MSRLRATEPVTVRIGECECPAAPHEQDEAYARPHLAVDDALEAMAIVMSEDPHEVISRKVGMIFLRGVSGWNLLDDTGQPAPLTAMTDGSLDWPAVKPIADALSDLYGPELIRPLAPTLPESSPPGQTEASTRATSTSSRRRPRR